MKNKNITINFIKKYGAKIYAVVLIITVVLGLLFDICGMQQIAAIFWITSLVNFFVGLILLFFFPESFIETEVRPIEYKKHYQNYDDFYKCVDNSLRKKNFSTKSIDDNRIIYTKEISLGLILEICDIINFENMTFTKKKAKDIIANIYKQHSSSLKEKQYRRVYHIFFIYADKENDIIWEIINNYWQIRTYSFIQIVMYINEKEKVIINRAHYEYSSDFAIMRRQIKKIL